MVIFYICNALGQIWIYALFWDNCSLLQETQIRNLSNMAMFEQLNSQLKAVEGLGRI